MSRIIVLEYLDVGRPFRYCIVYWVGFCSVLGKWAGAQVRRWNSLFTYSFNIILLSGSKKEIKKMQVSACLFVYSILLRGSLSKTRPSTLFQLVCRAAPIGDTLARLKSQVFLVTAVHWCLLIIPRQHQPRGVLGALHPLCQPQGMLVVHQQIHNILIPPAPLPSHHHQPQPAAPAPGPSLRHQTPQAQQCLRLIYPLTR